MSFRNPVIGLRVTPSLQARIDTAAADEMSRSELVRRAVIDYLDRIDARRYERPGDAQDARGK